MVIFYIFLFFLSPIILSAQQLTYVLPIYPGCPIVDENEKIKACFLENISKELKSNINNDILTIIEKEKIKQFNIYFSVDKNGKLIDFITPSYINNDLKIYFNNKFKELGEKLEREGKYIIPTKVNDVPGKIQLNTRLEF